MHIIFLLRRWKEFSSCNKSNIVSDEVNNPGIGENVKGEARVDGMNISFAHVGSFHIISGVMNWTLGGRR